jgi:transposase
LVDVIIDKVMHWYLIFTKLRQEKCAPQNPVPQTLLDWVKREEADGSQREELTAFERYWLMQLERENKERRRANEILKTASAFFAQAELDRRLKS